MTTNQPPQPGAAPLAHSLKSASAFFAQVRSKPFGGALTTPQVAGLTAILDVCGAAGWSVAWAADALGTAFLETNKTMQPVREAYWLSEAWRKANLRYWPHYGRGYVQCTWPENYARADAELGLHGTLNANLDRMLEPAIAAGTMVHGMAEGWFAKDDHGPHTLARHLPSPLGTRQQFEESRRIINGTDRKADLATYALAFQNALVAGGWA